MSTEPRDVRLGGARGTNRVPPHEVNAPTWAIGPALSARALIVVIGYRPGGCQLEPNASKATPLLVPLEVTGAAGVQPDAHTPMLREDSEIRIAVMVHVGRDERYHAFREVQDLDPAARDADDDSSWGRERQLDGISDTVTIEVGNHGCGCPPGEQADRRKHESDQGPNAPEREEWSQGQGDSILLRAVRPE
jgi:hypothetical protein